MSDIRPIGVFDSGSGGLSVRNRLVSLLPHESTIYVGDHANLPYGEKSRSFIRTRAIACLGYLRDRDVKLIVVACNAATVAGIEVYRKTFPDIPIIGVVPVVKTAAAVSRTKRFLVLSTVSTAKSHYQKSLIREFASGCDVRSIGDSHLVRLVEEGKQDEPETAVYLRTILTDDILAGRDTIVLGCTHFPFLASAIRTVVGPSVGILDSGDAVARHVSRVLMKEGLKVPEDHKARHEYFTSGNPRRVTEIFRKLTGAPVVVNALPDSVQ